MAFNIDSTKYNPSELEILRSLEADKLTSFDGQVFPDPVCLFGHKNSGPVDLDLTGAVFKSEVTLSLSNWRKVILKGATFEAGVNLSWCATDELDLREAVIHGEAHFTGLTADVLAEGTKFTGVVYAEPGTLREAIGDANFFDADLAAA